MNWFEIITENNKSIIEDTLKLIKNQIGLDLDLCDTFPGLIKTKNGKYFNVVVSQNIYESREYDLLEQFAKKYKLIRIESNGNRRIAIFPLT